MLDALGAGSGVSAAYDVAVDRLVWRRSDLQAEIARRVALPPERAAQYVEQLLAAGALRTTEGVPGSLRVRPPTSAFRDDLDRHRGELVRLQQELEARTALLDTLQQRWSAANDAQLSEVLQTATGLDAVRSRVEDMASSTVRERLSLFPAGALTEAGLIHRLGLDRDMLGRGVTIRAVVARSALHHRGAGNYPRLLHAAGAEVRTVAALPAHLAISDRATAALPIDQADVGGGVVLVRASSVVSCLVALFESVWGSATPLVTPESEAPVPMNPARFDAVTEEMLRVLASGATDDAVSHHLGVSTRTVRRAVAALMARLEVGSRFELGLELGRRGWTHDALPPLDVD